MSTTTLIQPLHTLPILDLNHPGANDKDYRNRREIITTAALEFHAQPTQIQPNSIPLIQYTREENQVWQHVYKKLQPLHQKHACSLYKDGRLLLNLPENHIPQLAQLSQQLQQLSNFHLEPIHGLVDARIFLSKLASNTMLCTQYIRHPSKPEFTPEPDIIHEVLGHVPLFTNNQLNHIS